MQGVNQLLGRASLWIHFRLWIDGLVVSLTGAAAFMLALRIVERLFGFPVDWRSGWIAALACAGVGSVAWVLLHRRSRLDVARVLDDRARLKESLSTALCVASADDPWSRAAVSQAESAARGVRVTRAIPMTAPRWWAAPAAVIALFLLAGLAPQLDLVGMVKRASAQEEQKKELVQAQAEAQAAQQEMREALASVKDPALEELVAPDAAPEANPPKTPLEVRLDAIKRLTSMQDRLNELRNGEKAATLEELRKKMSELREPRAGGELSELTKAMQKGDFAEAQKQLEKLAARLANGELSPEQKKAIEEQLKDLSKQMEQLANDRKELEKMLRESGLDPALASNPDALSKALEQMDSLTQEQKDRLAQMSQAMSKACEACKGMSGAMSKAAGKLAAGDGSGMGDMGEQLTAMEMLSQDLASLDAARRALKGRLDQLGMGGGKCSGDEFALTKNARGGGPGAGPRESAPTDIDGASKIKVKSHNQDGPIIGSTMVEGDQVRGESAQQFAEAVKAAEASAAEAIDSKRVPRELEDAVKRYFGRLEKKAPKDGEQAPDAPASDEPKDAEDSE